MRFLFPCPFCGNTETEYMSVQLMGSEDEPSRFICCHMCGARGPSQDDSNMPKAATLWNKADKHRQALIAVLENINRNPDTTLDHVATFIQDALKDSSVLEQSHTELLNTDKSSENPSQHPDPHDE